MAPALEDRLYLNDGRGHFRKADGRLPRMDGSGSRAAAADYRRGRRPRPVRRRARRSLALRHRSAQRAAAQRRPRPLHRRDRGGWRRSWPGSAWSPMPCGPTWTATAGRISWSWASGCRSRSSTTPAAGSWCASIRPGSSRATAGGTGSSPADFTGDGRADFVVGNLGLNTRLRATAAEPATMIVQGLRRQRVRRAGRVQLLGRRQLSARAARRSARAIPSLKVRFPSYEDYARATDGRHVLTPANWPGRCKSRRPRSPRPWYATMGTGRSRSCRCRGRRSSRRCMASWRSIATATGARTCCWPATSTA